MSFCIGRVEVTLDAKGRATLNANIRKLFDEGGMLTVAPYPKCAAFYQYPVWKSEVGGFVNNISFADKKAVQAALYLADNADVGIPDSQGRLVLPPQPREAAGLGKRVYIFALGERGLIFDADAFEEMRDTEFAPDDIRATLLEMKWGVRPSTPSTSPSE
jgi:MraZ protein